MNKIIILVFIFSIISCTDTNESKGLKEKISYQQKMIDSLTESKTESSHKKVVDTTHISKIENEKYEDFKEDAWIAPGEHRKCPIKIIDISTKYNDDFTAIGTLKLLNTHSKATTSLELDFGTSKKRLICKVPAKKTIVYKMKLTEDEAKNFTTIFNDGENFGLHFDKIIFTNGYMWETDSHGY